MDSTPQSLLVDYPVQVFWTPYDPLDLASGSLDPLGFARGYLSLADRFLPSFTTVTTVPRYVSMLCAASGPPRRSTDTNRGLPPHRPVQSGSRLVKSYERAWAIACGLAAQDPGIGQQAVRGLRGVRYVSRRLERFPVGRSTCGRGPSTCSPTRSATAVSASTRPSWRNATWLDAELHLVSAWRSACRSVPEAPPHGTPAHDEDARLSLDALREWGGRAHVGAFTAGEVRCWPRRCGGGKRLITPTAFAGRRTDARRLNSQPTAMTRGNFFAGWRGN